MTDVNPFTAVMDDCVTSQPIQDQQKCRDTIAALELEIADLLPCEDPAPLKTEIFKAQYRQIDMRFLGQSRADSWPVFAAHALNNRAHRMENMCRLSIMRDNRDESGKLFRRFAIGVGVGVYELLYRSGSLTRFWPEATWQKLRAAWRQTYGSVNTDKVKVSTFAPDLVTWRSSISADYPKMTIPGDVRAKVRRVMDEGLDPIMITEAPEWKLDCSAEVTRPDPLIVARYVDDWFLIAHFDLTKAEEIAYREWRI